ncbi:PREDICTED: uncharacterized protein LOC104802318 isoform X2 [Tarenaya hassleriana]|uniref:uncharacterized protein LOC104802318 isoform X2 n=1 Tax=Tarenaya hassleriana TaxID=28532 RepID=UPI00053C9A11|nr:PREDICTED: uncharacterized protein LOC104802318 isoform X2 [Tarenaya hassleriana]
MENPLGAHDERNRHASSSFAGRINGSGNPTAETSGMMHNPGISMEWTPDEQAILEDGLVRYASESNLSRYAKIAMQLRNKTIRDVALRCRWMTKKESGKRRKEDRSLSRRGRDKKERTVDASNSSGLVTQTNNQIFAPPLVPTALGATSEVLRENEQMFNEISGNLASLKLKKNITHFSKVRDNIQKLLDNFDNDEPEMMKQMPPIPVKMEHELVNTIIHFSGLPMQPSLPPSQQKKS